MTAKAGLASLLAEIRACTLCAEHLPLGPRPVLRASPTARIVIVGQAPGTRVHDSGVPWDDASGKRLRQWLGLDAASFYDEARIAIVPCGLCYPGRVERGGDLPPRPECAPRWHPPLLAAMPNIALTLLVGLHAQAHYLGKRRRRTLTETVQAWRDYLPDFAPTPHPSWRSTNWLNNNPWFEAETLPEIRRRVRALLQTGDS
jgi:uracil-DNA glycosylase